METSAIILDEPSSLRLGELGMIAPKKDDICVEIRYSGISSGTEKLFWTGEMPPFPGMGYPLVPGYESVGEVVEAGPESGFKVGETVFVPGANCFDGVRGLFGGAAKRLVAKGSRVSPNRCGSWTGGNFARFGAQRHDMPLRVSIQDCPT